MNSKKPRSSPPTSPTLAIKAGPKRRHAFTHESSGPAGSSATAGARRAKSDALQVRIQHVGKRRPLGEVASRVNLPPRTASVSPVRRTERPATTGFTEYGHQLSQDSILSSLSSRRAASPAEPGSGWVGGQDFLIESATPVHDDSGPQAGTLQERQMLALSSPRHALHQPPRSPWLVARSDVQTSSAQNRENISLDGSIRRSSGQRNDSRNESFTRHNRMRNMAEEKHLLNEVLRRNVSYVVPRPLPSSPSVLRRKSVMPTGRVLSDSLLDDTLRQSASKNPVYVSGEPASLHRSFFAGVPDTTSTPYIRKQPIQEDGSLVSPETSLEDPPCGGDAPLIQLSSPAVERNLRYDRFRSLPASNLPVVPSRFTSAPPISLMPMIATTTTHLHDDSILSSFQTTCGPSAVPPCQEGEERQREDADDRDDADLIPPFAPPKLLRTPSAVAQRAVHYIPKVSEHEPSDMDIEEDLVAKPGWIGDRLMLGHISQPATPTEIKEEPQDDEHYRHDQSPDNEIDSELPQPEVERALSAQGGLDGSDHEKSDDEESESESESEVKPRTKRNATFCLPDTPKIRVRIKRQYRKKGNRVALSDLDPKRVWMKILDDLPEMNSGEEDSDDSLLLVQTS